MSDLFSLAGKYVVVTGGTRGIGGAISTRLVRGGAIVLANHVRGTKAAEAYIENLKNEGLHADVCRADITRSGGIEELLEAVQKSGHRVSGLVHSAATGVHRPIGELTGRQFDWTFALNVKAYLELVQRLIPLFAEDASIVAISSAGAERAAKTYALVGASKGALESLSRHLALELAERKIRVNVVSPGAVLTEAWNILPNREERLKERISRSPNRRLTTGEEVAWAVHFLLSDASSGISGHTLVVDGGERIVE
jgi:NAD(P)-dependent dehydrogenase (short-subunit alcohol dehydrogenase family)